MYSMFADDIKIKRCGEQYLRKFFTTGTLEKYKCYSGKKITGRNYLYVVIPRITCGVISYKNIVVRIHTYGGQKIVRFFGINGNRILHPHIYSSGEACMGGFGYSNKMKEKDADIFMINILLFLQNINNGSLVSSINYAATELKNLFPLVRMIPHDFIIKHAETFLDKHVLLEAEDKFFYYYCKTKNGILNKTNVNKLSKFIQKIIINNNDYFADVLIPSFGKIIDEKYFRNTLIMGLLIYLNTNEIMYLINKNDVDKEIDINKEIRIIKNILYKINCSNRTKIYKKEIISQTKKENILKIEDLNESYKVRSRKYENELKILKGAIDEIDNK